MYKFLYSFRVSGVAGSNGQSVVKVESADCLNQVEINQRADLIYDKTDGEKGLVSYAATAVNSINFDCLVHKMHALGAVESSEVPATHSLLTIEKGELFAFEPKASTDIIPGLQRSTKVKLFNVNNDDLYVVMSNRDHVKVVQLDKSHIFNDVFYYTSRYDIPMNTVTRAVEFNIIFHSCNDLALFGGSNLKMNIERACKTLASDVWVGESPEVTVESRDFKYAGHAFNVRIVGEDDRDTFHQSFPAEELKKYMAIQSDIILGEPSLETFNVIII